MIPEKCNCGDTYCPQCGDPKAALWDEAWEYMTERAQQRLRDETEIDIFFDAGMHAVEQYRTEPPL